jgi:hypothetical protein
MLHKRKREDTEKSERQYKRIHIAELIQEYEENEDNNITFDAFNLSDTEEESEDASIINGNNVDAFENTNNNDILNSEQWAKIIENWIEMVDAEN